MTARLDRGYCYSERQASLFVSGIYSHGKPGSYRNDSMIVPRKTSSTAVSGCFIVPEKTSQDMEIMVGASSVPVLARHVGSQQDQVGCLLAS